MTMADKRDKTSYIINNPIKKLLGKNGYMLSRRSTKNFDGQWIYDITKIGLGGVKQIGQFTRNELLDAYSKGNLIEVLNKKEIQ